jgi:hypothetical protein
LRGGKLGRRRRRRMKEDIYPLDDCFDWHIDTTIFGVEDRTGTRSGCTIVCYMYVVYIR